MTRLMKRTLALTLVFLTSGAYGQASFDGKTERELLTAKGVPTGQVSLGKKTIYTWDDATVTVEAGVVTNTHLRDAAKENEDAQHRTDAIAAAKAKADAAKKEDDLRRQALVQQIAAQNQRNAAQAQQDKIAALEMKVKKMEDTDNKQREQQKMADQKAAATAANVRRATNQQEQKVIVARIATLDAEMKQLYAYLMANTTSPNYSTLRTTYHLKEQEMQSLKDRYYSLSR